MGVLWGHFRVAIGTLWLYSKNTFGVICGNYCGTLDVTSGVHWGDFGGTLESFWEYSGDTLSELRAALK